MADITVEVYLGHIEETKAPAHIYTAKPGVFWLSQAEEHNPVASMQRGTHTLSLPVQRGYTVSVIPHPAAEEAATILVIDDKPTEFRRVIQHGICAAASAGFIDAAWHITDEQFSDNGNGSGHVGAEIAAGIELCRGSDCALESITFVVGPGYRKQAERLAAALGVEVRTRV